MDLRLPKLDGLKERFTQHDTGFARNARNARNAQQFDEFEVEDFGEYAFDDTADYARTHSAAEPITAHLVSVDDVRAQTRYNPSYEQTGEHFQLKEERRSPGLESLFDPRKQELSHADAQDTSRMTQDPDLTHPMPRTDTVAREVTPAVSHGVATPYAQTTAGARMAARAATAGLASGAPRDMRRNLVLLKPAQFSDIEQLVAALKEGNACILVLTDLAEALRKRVLDFGFGAACACDACVDCIADQVFVFARGAALSDAEKQRLHSQGII